MKTYPPTLLELADLLVSRYLRKPYAFHAKMRTNGDVSESYLEDGVAHVKWYVGDGLTILLHEIGHVRLGHLRTEHVCKAQDIAHEAEAWRWAEYAAHKHGFPFDYTKADHHYRTYQPRRMPITRVAWRWAPSCGRGPADGAAEGTRRQ